MSDLLNKVATKDAAYWDKMVDNVLVEELYLHVADRADDLLNGTCGLKLTAKVLTVLHGMKSLLAAEKRRNPQLMNRVKERVHLQHLDRLITMLKSLTHLSIERLPSDVVSRTVDMACDLGLFPNMKVLELKNLLVANDSKTNDQKEQVVPLQGLAMLRNKVETISATGCLQSLESLFVQCLGDQVLRDEAGVWQQLKVFSGRRNNLTQLDDSLKFLPQVELLDLSHNRLTKMEYVQYCRNLQFLNLGHNAISNVIGANMVLPNITTLILRHNELTDVSPLAKCFSLEKLDLAHNHIHDFTQVLSLQVLPNIQSVLFNGNPIARVKSYRSCVFGIFKAPLVESMTGFFLDDVLATPLERRQAMNTTLESMLSDAKAQLIALKDLPEGKKKSKNEKRIKKMKSSKRKKRVAMIEGPDSFHSTTGLSDKDADSRKSSTALENSNPEKETDIEARLGVQDHSKRIEAWKKELGDQWLTKLSAYEDKLRPDAKADEVALQSPDVMSPVVEASRHSVSHDNVERTYGKESRPMDHRPPVDPFAAMMKEEEPDIGMSAPTTAEPLPVVKNEVKQPVATLTETPATSSKVIEPEPELSEDEDLALLMGGMESKPVLIDSISAEAKPEYTVNTASYTKPAPVPAPAPMVAQSPFTAATTSVPTEVLAPPVEEPVIDDKPLEVEPPSVLLNTSVPALNQAADNHIPESNDHDASFTERLGEMSYAGAAGEDDDDDVDMLLNSCDCVGERMHGDTPSGTFTILNLQGDNLKELDIRMNKLVEQSVGVIVDTVIESEKILHLYYKVHGGGNEGKTRVSYLVDETTTLLELHGLLVEKVQAGEQVKLFVKLDENTPLFTAQPVPSATAVPTELTLDEEKEPEVEFLAENGAQIEPIEENAPDESVSMFDAMMNEKPSDLFGDDVTVAETFQKVDGWTHSNKLVAAFYTQLCGGSKMAGYYTHAETFLAPLAGCFRHAKLTEQKATASMGVIPIFLLITDSKLLLLENLETAEDAKARAGHLKAEDPGGGMVPLELLCIHDLDSMRKIVFGYLLQYFRIDFQAQGVFHVILTRSKNVTSVLVPALQQARSVEYTDDDVALTAKIHADVFENDKDESIKLYQVVLQTQQAAFDPFASQAHSGDVTQSSTELVRCLIISGNHVYLCHENFAEFEFTNETKKQDRSLFSSLKLTKKTVDSSERRFTVVEKIALTQFSRIITKKMTLTSCTFQLVFVHDQLEDVKWTLSVTSRDTMKRIQSAMS